MIKNKKFSVKCRIRWGKCNMMMFCGMIMRDNKNNRISDDNMYIIIGKHIWNIDLKIMLNR